MHRHLRLPAAIVALALAACGEDRAGTQLGTGDPELVRAVCTADQCAIGLACVDNLTPNPDNPCEACFVALAKTRWSPWDSGPCDDASACTFDDACNAGRCVGTAIPCDDGDPCTTDGCDDATGACTATPDVVKCGADPCAATDGAVAAGPPGCDDGDPCTDDRCEPFAGCVHEPADAEEPIACDDGDACTTGDTCRDGACEGAAAIDCDDGDLCTVDLCGTTSAVEAAAPGCRHEPLASLCADDNPCTDEACDPERGCVYPFNDDPCDDHDACTTADRCGGGACRGAPVALDDGNPCTDDGCDPAIGVAHVPNALPCDDGNACTLGDRCRAGVCVPGATPLACDDDNQCTDDACLPASGCAFVEHDRACDDDSLCTADDVCVSGQCLGARVDCDDGNACTTDACAPAIGCTNELIVSDPCRPDIVVSYPPRGATLTEGAGQTITVTGTARSGAGPITSLRVNGVATAVAADGSFSRAITPTHGGNFLVIEATDSFGSVNKVVQSFLWSRAYRHPTTAKNGVVPDGVGVWLDTLAIDDGNRASPPNDLASILQIALRAFDIAALIPRPAANNLDAGDLVGTYDIYVNNLTYSPPTAQLWPQAGGIHMRGRLTNGRANIAASKQCSAGFFSCWGPGSITGTLTFTAITIDVDLDLSVVNNAIVVTVRSSNVAIDGVDIAIDGAFGWLLEFVLSFFEDDLVQRIESAFNGQLAPVIGPLVRDGLAALAFQVPLAIPKVQGGGTIGIDLVTDWRSVTCSSAGCRIVLRGGVYSDQKVTPYTNQGVPNRDACGNGTQALIIPELKVLELSLADDTLNQLLFAIWRGGLLEFPVPAAWLRDVDLGRYGISNLVMNVSGLLAPTASDCGGNGLEAHLGDVKVTASMRLFGQPVNVVIYASAVAGLQLYLDGRSLGVRLTGLRRVETEVQVLEPELISLEPVIADLIETEVLGGIIAQLGDGDLGSFPLPDIDLAGAIPGLPAGTGIAIAPETLTRNQGNTIAGGRLD